MESVSQLGLTTAMSVFSAKGGYCGKWTMLCIGGARRFICKSYCQIISSKVDFNAVFQYYTSCPHTWCKKLSVAGYVSLRLQQVTKVWDTPRYRQNFG